MKSFSDYIVITKNIRHNLFEYKKIDTISKICAVVKADGYGIGSENVVCAIDDDVDFYAVACFGEAERLRKLTQRKILVLNKVKKDMIEQCSKKDISISISSFYELKKIISLNLQRKVKIHLAINTGMNRIGFANLNEFCKAVIYIKQHLDKIDVEGIFTHIYNATNFSDSKTQICIFNQYLNILSQYFELDKIIKHASASLGAVKYPEFRFDMVRLGILLYGDLEENHNLNLKQVLNVKSKIINIARIKKGESVGYGKNYIAKKNMTVATIPLGYADGIFRSISKKGYVKVRNQFCKIVGNICMDMFMIDVTNKNVKLGDIVTVLDDTITANILAEYADTISYEILTNIKKNRFNLKIY